MFAHRRSSQSTSVSKSPKNGAEQPRSQNVPDGRPASGTQTGPFARLRRAYPLARHMLCMTTMRPEVLAVLLATGCALDDYTAPRAGAGDGGEKSASVDAQFFPQCNCPQGYSCDDGRCFPLRPPRPVFDASCATGDSSDGASDVHDEPSSDATIESGGSQSGAGTVRCTDVSGLWSFTGALQGDCLITQVDCSLSILCRNGDEGTGWVDEIAGLQPSEAVFLLDVESVTGSNLSCGAYSNHDKLERSNCCAGEPCWVLDGTRFCSN